MNKLVNICNKINIEISDDQINCFEKYYELLIEKNKVMNLTAITDKEDVIVKHFIDSIALIPYLLDKGINTNNELKIIDIGTGALPCNASMSLSFNSSITSFKKETLLLRESSKVNLTSGIIILSGSPGNPAPVPISMIFSSLFILIPLSNK